MFTYLSFWCFIYRCVWLMTTSSHLPLPMKPDRCLSSIVTVIPLWIASSISGPDGSYPNPWVQLASKILVFSIILLVKFYFFIFDFFFFFFFFSSYSVLMDTLIYIFFYLHKISGYSYGTYKNPTKRCSWNITQCCKYLLHSVCVIYLFSFCFISLDFWILDFVFSV